MDLTQEARDILQVFADKNCKVGEVIDFTNFGTAIIWEAGGIHDAEVRLALQTLTDEKYVVEHQIGLSITPKGLKEVSRKIPSTLVGAAGEHFVMYQLYRRGIMVGQPPQGVANVDLLVLDEDAAVIKNIQVKTRSKGADGGWHMKKKHEELTSPLLWYVFVDMESESPTCHIIPSEVVAKAIRVAHETWMATPGIKGQPHKDTDMRRIRPQYPFELQEFPDGWMNKYLERWDLLRT